MKIVSALIFTAIVATSIKECMFEYLLVEVDDAEKEGEFSLPYTNRA